MQGMVAVSTTRKRLLELEPSSIELAKAEY